MQLAAPIRWKFKIVLDKCNNSHEQDLLRLCLIFVTI